VKQHISWSIFSYNAATGQYEKQRKSVLAANANAALQHAKKVGHLLPMVQPEFRSEAHANWYLNYLRMQDLRALAAV
jgi:hypothetical protein